MENNEPETTFYFSNPPTSVLSPDLLPGWYYIGENPDDLPLGPFETFKHAMEASQKAESP